MPTVTPAVAGLSASERTARRHALVERMLVDVVGVPWHHVHREADRWGDEISEEVELHLTALLGDPGTCPHGNPIPGSANVPDQSGARPLATMPPGPVRVVRIGEVVEDDDDAMAQLALAGFTPGADCEVVEHGADGVLVAGSLDDALIAATTADEVWVEQV